MANRLVKWFRNRPVEHLFKWLVPELRWRLSRKGEVDAKDIPIVINNFNRLSMLKTLISGLEQRGYRNLHIIDNASDYPPLLDWYIHECPYPVHLLHRNVGHLAVWETGLYKQFTHSWFAYTDSDLELHPDCPDDFVARLIGLLERHPRALKAGLSLCIDDLPDCFRNKEEVQRWESQFWKRKVRGEDAFWAPVDTTFAVYKPYFKGEVIDFGARYIRSDFPCSARHLPWYQDSSCLSEEERYYIGHVRTSTHWSAQA